MKLMHSQGRIVIPRGQDWCFTGITLGLIAVLARWQLCLINLEVQSAEHDRLFIAVSFGEQDFTPSMLFVVFT